MSAATDSVLMEGIDEAPGRASGCRVGNGDKAGGTGGKTAERFGHGECPPAAGASPRAAGLRPASGGRDHSTVRIGFGIDGVIDFKR